MWLFIIISRCIGSKWYGLAFRHFKFFAPLVVQSCETDFGIESAKMRAILSTPYMNGDNFQIELLKLVVGNVAVSFLLMKFPYLFSNILHMLIGFLFLDMEIHFLNCWFKKKNFVFKYFQSTLVQFFIFGLLLLRRFEKNRKQFCLLLILLLNFLYFFTYYA